MKKRSTPFGFSQRVQLEWLNQTAELALSGKKPDEIRLALNEMLSDKLSVNSTKEAGSGSNRDKVVSIMTKIWVTPPPHLTGLRKDGLQMLNRLPRQERLPIHWGMSMAVYPFFGQVAETVGRLLRLQNTISATQVQRRLCEQLGEGETVSRAARRVIRSFVDWGVLLDTPQLGMYQAASPINLTDRELLTWLLEAVLISTDAKTGLLNVLTEAPSLYPFKFASTTVLQPEINPRLELFYQGVDQRLISLRA